MTDAFAGEGSIVLPAGEAGVGNGVIAHTREYLLVVGTRR